MSKEGTYDEASHVTAVEGQVFVTGPDSVDVALAPEAAAETSDRLLHEAARASGQQRLSRLDDKPKA